MPEGHKNSIDSADILLSTLLPPPTVLTKQTEDHDPLDHPASDPLPIPPPIVHTYDDQREVNGSPTTNGPGLFTRFRILMSKAPLLLRSAPGFGTGSYGAVPAGSSIESSDEENENLRWPPLERKKGSSRLRHQMSTGSGRSSKRSARDVSHSSVRLRNSTSRLRMRRDTGDSTRSSGGGESLQEGLEEGLEARYSSGAIPIAGCEDVLEDSDLAAEEDEDSDEAEVEEDSTNDEEDPPDNSPYAQVRASVAATDNTTLSISTPRMWFLSLLFAILGSSTNLFFSLRYPSVAITPVIALLLVHPMGLLWDRILKRRTDPEETFLNGVLIQRNPSDPIKGSRLRLWLAQGRWNEKEHSCVYISSNVSFGFAFATDVIVEQTKFYNQDVGIVYQLLLILSTQILGYTFAGLTRRFLVRPGGMIWPGTLMSAAMFTTLHKEENKIANGWKITRWKFFFIVWSGAFVFYFLPGLLFPALSYFNVITWFAPKNVVVANLFGVASGLGLFPVTFDWAQIAYIGSPLLTPFWAAMNVVGGLVIVMWIIAPIAYYKNLFSSSYMPILSSAVFDNTGKVYDVSKILTSDFLFDKEAYKSYSRVFLPITYVLSYGLQFAALSSLLTHTVCWYGKDIWKQWRRSLKEVEGENKGVYEPIGVTIRRSSSDFNDSFSQEDVHNRLMKKYQDAPISWYLLTFVSMTAIGMFVVE
jgi:hypothetical protein